MKNRFKILTAFLFGFIIFGNSKIFAQFFILHDRAIISGYVFEESNGNPIPYVNVYVKRTRYGTITDTSGHFIISAKLNDTIVFSVLGFDKKYIIINDSAKDNSNPLILFLNTKIYELKSVDIIALRKYKQLEYEIKNMKLPDDAYTNALRNFPFRPPDIDYYARGTNPSFGLIFNPITALYDLFSKEGKEKQKLMELQKNDDIFTLINNKIPITNLVKILNTTTEDFNKFILWCNFNTDFINSLSEYDFVNLLKIKFKQYKINKQ